MNPTCRYFLCSLVLSLFLAAASDGVADDSLVRREWTVDGVQREALIHAPPNAKSEAAPLVFVFHGHGGTMQNVARVFAIHTLWPEALVVYMQGLNTSGRIVDPEGTKPGWQFAPGDEGDRDLKFFDAVLASLRQDFHVDDRRIYVTGHSNGGSFTYLLWAMRGDLFAAVAPSSTVAAQLIPKLKPKPVMHLAGEQDTLVKFEWQQRMMQALRNLNGCGDGTPWEKWCQLYPSKSGTPVVTFIHPGTHQFPADAPATIVKFFKEHPRS